MNTIPKGLDKELLLKLDPPSLFNACRINKNYNNICRDDRFWKNYYYIQVDPRWEIHPQLKVKGKWKEAFFRNYSVPQEINLGKTRSSDLWNITMVNTDKYDDEIYYYDTWNYITVKREPGKLTGIPVLLPESFDKSLSGDYIIIELNEYLEDGLPIIKGKWTQGNDKNNPDKPVLENMIYTQKVISYPYHHILTIFTNNMNAGRIKPANLYEGTMLEMIAGIDDISINNAIISFTPGDTLVPVYPNVLKSLEGFIKMTLPR